MPLTTLLNIGIMSQIARVVYTELDYMEYATDAAAQAAYISNGAPFPKDAYTTGTNTLLCHFDVAKATSVTASTGQTITYEGTADCVDTQSKFGGKSLLLDGNSDFVTLPDSANWAFGTGNFTIDFWVRLELLTGTHNFISQYVDSENQWYINWDATNFGFRSADSSTVRALYYFNWSPTISTWYHCAVVRNGTSLKIYINGVSQTLNENTVIGSNSLADFAAVLKIGSFNSNNYLNGYIDELRILKGTAVWTANFNDVLQSYSEATIKTQGSYALKGVAETSTSSGKILTKTISTLNLTGKNTIKFDIRSSRTGSTLKLGIHDAGGTTSEYVAAITAANTFEEKTWDISGVSAANKDAIDSILITVTEATTANTFYIDNMRYG